MKIYRIQTDKFNRESLEILQDDTMFTDGVDLRKFGYTRKIVAIDELGLEGLLRNLVDTTDNGNN